MRIRILNNNYKDNEQFYRDFLSDRINDNDSYFTNEYIEIDEAPDFPIYMGTGSEEKKTKDFMLAFRTIADSYINTDRDLHMSEAFWHSLLVTKKREYILKNYPSVHNSIKNFKNIVIKKFDWENYIYRCVLAVEYIEDQVEDPQKKAHYYKHVINNLDVFNYIIKYSVFRNAEFVIKILSIIDDLGISEIMKARIKDRSDLGKDERYGRRVIFELNKNYPVIMSPLLDEKRLTQEVTKALSYYSVPNVYDYVATTKEV